MPPPAHTLHVAALPYPTSQGTQAALGMMVSAIVEAGRSSALLTYRAGVGTESRFRHLTSRGLATPASMRSGPSLGKLLADVELLASLRAHARDARVVFAHHVEAAALAGRLGHPPHVFVAHTDLGPELPTYFASWLAPVARRAGAALDRHLARSAPALAAISPAVARVLERVSDRDVAVLPVPIARIAPSLGRASARVGLGLAPEARVILYAGNLDAYQGLDGLVRAVSMLSPVTLLVATESATAPLAERLRAARVHHVFMPLQIESDRARAHAAADLAVVPRLSPGGLPIKLLDALARGVPVVAMQRALAGLPLDSSCLVTDDDDLALAEGLRTGLAMGETARCEQIARGHAYLAEHNTPARLLTAVDLVTERAFGARNPRWSR